MKTLLALLLVLQSPYQPVIYQTGKDVVWVGTPSPMVDTMLDLAHVTAADVVLDLGSGDGRIVIAAAKRGAVASGVEYNPDLLALSQRNADAAGVSDRATFTRGDLFQADLSRANVITLFLTDELNLRLRQKILLLKPGTRIVSNTFTMGSWAPTAQRRAKNCDRWCNALFWIVPVHFTEGE